MKHTDTHPWLLEPIMMNRTVLDLECYKKYDIASDFLSFVNLCIKLLLLHGIPINYLHF